MDRARREALLDVVEMRQPLHEAIAALRSFPWDSEVELLPLSRADALRVIDA